MVAALKISASGARLAEQLRQGVRHAGILESFQRVAREAFLTESLMPAAGDNTALPIGYAQTTSCPLVMARMMEMVFAGIPAPAKILEVGVGCGYQTALLAEMGCEVVGLERIGALADAARRRLAAYGKVCVRHVDGLTGAQPEAPFAGILVCAECEEIPIALVGQLQEEGRLVLPLRRRGSVRLTAVGSDGKILSRRDPVAFVPIREGVA